MTKDQVYVLLTKADEIYYDGEFWDITLFNEEEACLKHCEDGDEITVSLDDIAKGKPDFYELKKIAVEGEK